jgi:hypothetical protein
MACKSFRVYEFLGTWKIILGYFLLKTLGKILVYGSQWHNIHLRVPCRCDLA